MTFPSALEISLHFFLFKSRSLKAKGSMCKTWFTVIMKGITMWNGWGCALALGEIVNGWPVSSWQHRFTLFMMVNCSSHETINKVLVQCLRKWMHDMKHFWFYSHGEWVYSGACMCINTLVDPETALDLLDHGYAFSLGLESWTFLSTHQNHGHRVLLFTNWAVNCKQSWTFSIMTFRHRTSDWAAVLSVSRGEPSFPFQLPGWKAVF